MGRAMKPERQGAQRSGTLFVRCSMLALLLCGVPDILRCQRSDHHTVMVVVQPVSVLQTSVSTVQLPLNGAGLTAGQDAMSVSDQTTVLLWGTNSSLQKISVRTNLTAQKFVTKALAVAPTAGTAASEVTLSAVDKDLVLAVGRSAGSATIRYTGIALASQGTGSDIHTITFTIVAQ